MCAGKLVIQQAFSTYVTRRFVLIRGVQTAWYGEQCFGAGKHLTLGARTRDQSKLQRFDLQRLSYLEVSDGSRTRANALTRALDRVLPFEKSPLAYHSCRQISLVETTRNVQDLHRGNQTACNYRRSRLRRPFPKPGLSDR